MLRSAKDILDFRLHAVDGDIGKCADFIFEDGHWGVRYLVVDTGPWLLGRKVILSPIFFEEPDWEAGRFQVRLKKEQIENAPPLDSRAPVSRKYAVAWTRYYATQPFWTGPEAAAPKTLPKHLRAEAARLLERQIGDDEPLLRSTDEVTGYEVEGTDGRVGYVDDFLIDDEGWMIRYFIVDTRKWLPGRRILSSPRWVRDVDWVEREVRLSLSCEQIESSPEFDPDTTVRRSYEEELHAHYGEVGYWMD